MTALFQITQGGYSVGVSLITVGLVVLLAIGAFFLSDAIKRYLNRR